VLLSRLEFEGLVAFIEISIRLTTAMTAELDAFNTAIGDAAGQISVLMEETHVWFMHTFMVSALLLEFGSASTSFTARQESPLQTTHHTILLLGRSQFNNHPSHV
jgi:hypothetical protein